MRWENTLLYIIPVEKKQVELKNVTIMQKLQGHKIKNLRNPERIEYA